MAGAAGFAMGSGVTSIFSGAASLQAASMQARQFKLQGMFLDLQANQEKLKAREQATFLRQKFLRDIGSANASFAGRGVSTGSGIGRQLAIQGLRTLGEDLQATELNSEAAQDAIRVRQTQVKVAQKTARNMGLLRASGSFQKGGQSLLTGFKSIGGAG